MNIKISVAFYTVIAIFQKKIKKTILFLIHQKKKKKARNISNQGGKTHEL